MTDQIKNGDAVFWELYDQHSAAFFGLFLRHTQSYQLAQSLTLDLFLELRQILLENPDSKNMDLGQLLGLARRGLEKAGWDVKPLASIAALAVLLRRPIPEKGMD